MDALKEVKKAQKGNTSAFEKLIISHQLILYRVAKTILKKDEDCADAVQETVLNAYRKIHTLREPSYFKSWLCRILINECYNIVNRRKNLIALDKWMEPPTPDRGYEEIEIDQMLQTLPPEQGQLLKLFHIEDISIRDLAAIFEVPENTIKTRLRRAREKMRENWCEGGDLNGKMGTTIKK